MIKRFTDMFAAGLAIVFLSPLLICVGLIVRIGLGSPILFKQSRPGLHGRPFKMYKFRTMLNATGPNGEPLPDSERLTRLGRFLRATSLDELPELYNVLRGDMSLVGPRPLLMEYLTHYTPYQARRHEVRPGVTGWAQVNGRNALSWEERFELDVWYVEHQSLALDFRILAMTILKVLKREGVTEPGEATMTRFRGAGS